MVRIIVSILSVIVQLLIIVIIGVGALLGFAMLPDVLPFGERSLSLPGFMKILIGSGISILATAIFLGPALVLLDMRKTLLSIDVKLDSVLDTRNDLV